MTETQPPQAFVQRQCPLCEAAEARLWLSKGSLRLVRCLACSMVYANPVESELATGKFYDRLSAPFYLSPDKLQSDYAPVRFDRELRLFRAYVDSGEVLDVGCSTGAFQFQLRQRFPGAYRVSGLDVAGAALDYAAGQGIDVIRAPFLEYDFAGRQFDAITFWAVMEHLTTPKPFLSQAASILKSGGHCFILVPNLQSLAVRLLGRKYRYIFPDHVNYFTAETLRRFARTASTLQSVCLTQMHFNPMVILKDFRSSQSRVADADRARLLKRTTALKQNRLLTPLRWLYRGLETGLVMAGLADNLVIVLRKQGRAAAESGASRDEGRS